jgi:hypothetical protein
VRKSLHEGLPMLLTADTITDDQIEKLLLELNGADYAACVVALHDQPTPPRAVRAARERCAEIFNARNRREA